MYYNFLIFGFEISIIRHSGFLISEEEINEIMSR